MNVMYYWQNNKVTGEIIKTSVSYLPLKKEFNIYTVQVFIFIS